MPNQSSYPNSEPDLRTHPVAVDSGESEGMIRRAGIALGCVIILLLIAVILTFFIPIETRVGWAQSFEEDSFSRGVVQSVFFHNRLREPMNYVFSNRNEIFETSFQPQKIAWVNVRLRFAEPLSQAETFRLRVFDSASMSVMHEVSYDMEPGVVDQHIFTEYLPKKVLRIEVEHMSREDPYRQLPTQIYITADH